MITRRLASLAVALSMLTLGACFDDHPMPDHDINLDTVVTQTEPGGGLYTYADPDREVVGSVDGSEPLPSNAGGDNSSFDVTTNSGGTATVDDVLTPAYWTIHTVGGPCDGMTTPPDILIPPGGFALLNCNLDEDSNPTGVDSQAQDADSDVVPDSPPFSPGDSNTMSYDANQYLYPNDGVVYSPSGQYRIQYQGDGNLVLVDTSTDPWTPVWATATNYGTPGEVAMQWDGNLVVYDSDNDPLWSSGTAGNDGAYLVVGDDGHLIICDANGVPIWWNY